MAEVLIAVGVIVALSAFLSVLLIVADSVLLDYGVCTITINQEEEKKVEGGKSLLNSLMEQEIFVPSACGGRGSCGLCKVTVEEGAGPLLPTETPHLTEEEVENDVRLSCQIKVRQDMSIVLPEEILSLQQYEAEVEKIVELNYDTRLIRLRLIEPEQMEFTPGQYIQLETPPYGKTPEPVYRAYSIASPLSEPGTIELIIRRVPDGICTTYVFEVLEEGDSATLNGPYGEFYLRDTDAEVVFVAGGSGIAPIRSILYRMAEEQIQRRATFFYGANERRDLYLVDQMREFEQKIPSFEYVPALARPAPDDVWDGETGLVTEVVEGRRDDLSGCEGYLCGSPAMIDATVDVLTELGIPEDKIYYDKFA
ncbi:MAG: NADH:ubiquinone reductase (Na(+)-transporting) subunit F [Planctomycetota bacterium]